MNCRADLEADLHQCCLMMLPQVSSRSPGPVVVVEATPPQGPNVIENYPAKASKIFGGLQLGIAVVMILINFGLLGLDWMLLLYTIPGLVVSYPS